MKPRSGYLLLLALPGLLLSGPAEGFERSRDPSSRYCLWWKHRTVPMVLHENCSTDVPLAACAADVWASFDVWNQPTCSDFLFAASGTTDRTEVGFDNQHWNDNINLVIWIESGWRHEHDAIAMTTTTYDVSNGEIVDADIEVNGQSFTFTSSQSANVLIDIRNTLAHEAGHIVGLDHTPLSDATMYSTAPQGETKKRDLAQDDIDGLCFIYPIDYPTLPCPDAIPPDDDGGCDCASSDPGNRPAEAGPLLAASLLWLGWVKRHRRRCARCHPSHKGHLP